MRVQSNKINNLVTQRYQNLSPYNVTYSFFAGSYLEPLMNPTYEETTLTLESYFNEKSRQNNEKSYKQQYRNHVSTLNSFLASIGKTEASRVGAELSAQFDRSLSNYLSVLTVSSRSKNDRRAHLRLIKKIYEKSNHQNSNAKRTTDLSTALRMAIARTELAPKTIARRAGLSTSAMQRWLAGSLPNVNGIPTLRRLEKELGLERDSLVSLVSGSKPSPDALPVVAIAHRQKMSKVQREGRYVLRLNDLSPDFQNEWRALLEYKTTPMPLLERQARGSWRCIPADTYPKVHTTSICRGMVCPTASFVLLFVRKLLTLTLRHQEHGGLIDDIADANAQTLAWLALPAALSCYIDYVASRSNGVMHNGISVASSAFASLLRPKTGFLWQQPKLRNKLPERFRPESDDEWRRLCEHSHKMLRNVIQKSKGKSRIPFDPIASLLVLDNSLQPILDAISRLDSEAATAPPGSLSQALAKRDALLLSFILSNPLRSRTLMSLTWSEHGASNIRGSSRAGWRVHIPSHQLKNGEFQCDTEYSAKISILVMDRIDEYLHEYRNTILQGKECKYFFVSTKSMEMWATLPKRVLFLTKRLIPGSPGFGPQAFRHIVATDWLKTHPNDFLAVAELLNDNIETVMKNYSHLKRESSFARYDNHLAKLIKATSTNEKRKPDIRFQD